MFYSKTTNTFYPEEFKSVYKRNNTWPVDAVEVPHESYIEFGEGKPPFGKIRGCDTNGYPAWVDLVVSDSQNAVVEASWIQQELDRATEELNKVQDSDPKAVGTVSEWRNYRKEVRAWNENPLFPDKLKRPVSPDNKE